MTTPQLARIDEHLRKLRLYKLRERLDALLQEASAQECSYVDFLDRVLSEEAASKHDKQVAMHTAIARFPYMKTLEAFDFSFQPSIDKKKVQELAAGQYIERAENIVLLGPPRDRQDASSRRPWPQGGPAGLPDAVHRRRQPAHSTD
jgi:DNA replication protein DnaC